MDYPIDPSTGRRPRLSCAVPTALMLATVVALIPLCGCGATAPATRQANALRQSIDDERGATQAALRKQLRAAWRIIALQEYLDRLNARPEDRLTLEAAREEAEVLLRQVERGDALLAGYAEHDAQLADKARDLGRAIDNALAALEERSAAAEALAGAIGPASAALAEGLAEKRAREAAEEAARKAAEAAAREEE